MRKFTFILLMMLLTISMLAGCRREMTGQPGDPTVNSSSTNESTRETIIPSMTTRATETPITTENTTVPFDTNETVNSTNETNETTTNGRYRNRNHMSPHN